MRLIQTPKFTRKFLKLPLAKQKKFYRLVKLITQNARHPSLRARKMGGLDIYEARLDLHYRFTYQLIGEELYFLTIGPHDTGLGKK